MQRQCEVRSWFRACGRPAAGSCQYCGRSFCDQHGTFEGEHQEICSRKVCREKLADVRAHDVYKAEVSQRNRLNRCGAPGCEERPAGQCSRCNLLFCESHLLDRTETVTQGRSTIRRPVSTCGHCWERRILWSRR